MNPILPSEPPDAHAPRPPWSRLHARLHQQLLHHPALLPAGRPLLLAVSGGQDSMAMTRLLQDLQRLHHWPLHLWHGNHGWRPEAGEQARELQAWAREQGLPMRVEQADPAMPHTEAAARRWRYARLEVLALHIGCSHVLTGHTASDRSETLLLQLARGSHAAGLGSLRRQRPLSTGSAITLVRPLLDLTRNDTLAICERWGQPFWTDPSNANPRFSRNRVRAEVLPVLEALHPGASQRISALSERLAAEQDASNDLADLGLRALTPTTPGTADRLDRRALMALHPANQRRLLHRWLEQHSGQTLAARPLEALLLQLAPTRGPGFWALPQGQTLHWDRQQLWLSHPSSKQRLQNHQPPQPAP